MVKVIVIDSDENADWLRTPETRVRERWIYKELAQRMIRGGKSGVQVNRGKAWKWFHGIPVSIKESAKEKQFQQLQALPKLIDVEAEVEKGTDAWFHFDVLWGDIPSLVLRGGPGSGHHGHTGGAGGKGSPGGSKPSKGSVAVSGISALDKSGLNLTEQDLVDMFSLPGGYSADIAVESSRHGVFVEVHWKDGAGEDIGKAARVFDTNGEVMNMSLEFSSEFQGRGLAESLYSRQIARCKERGFDKITLCANVTIGRYAWAKKGFDYQADWRADNATREFKGWASKKGIKVSPGDWPKFKSARDVATYKIPGVSVLGSQITNGDVPSSMKMSVGKAFMLDTAPGGHGFWMAALSLKG